jgi:protein-tyrosine-phosphatase
LKPVLFVCVENAGRSQMAEALARRYGLAAMSAGTVPASRVHPSVVKVMREKGIDLPERKPRALTADMINEAGLVVTMGCSVAAACPRPMLASMQKKLIDWDLDDPRGKSLDEVRRIREEIERRVKALARRRPRPSSAPRGLRRELLSAASEGRSVTYGSLMKQFGLSRGRRFSSALGDVDMAEHLKGAPGFAAIVVRKDTGYPGGGYFCDDELPPPLRRPRSRCTDPALSAEEMEHINAQRRLIWRYYGRKSPTT